MSVIYIMLPVALLLAALAVWGFIRAVRGGQYDDMDTPAMRAIQPDDVDAVAPSDHARD
jgi:cbb3-type cytochrome oxidase maturation protein